MQAHLSPARIESILSAVKSIRLGQSLTVKQFQRLLGLMSAASNVIAFGLFYMRHMQWGLRTKGFPRGAAPFHIIKFMRQCLHVLVTWKKPWVLSQGPILGASCRRKMLTTDASLMGWGVILRDAQVRVCRRTIISHGTSTVWRCWLYFLLKNFLADLSYHHVLVYSDYTSPT